MRDKDTDVILDLRLSLQYVLWVVTGKEVAVNLMGLTMHQSTEQFYRTSRKLIYVHQNFTYSITIYTGNLTLQP